MLEEIRIQNFAIIDKLELDLAPGFNVITGETGAGKSIIIDAVELLLGGKADGGTVRAGEERALIEGTFGLKDAGRSLLLPILQREDLAAPEELKRMDSITLSRELRRNGRSSARINGVTVSTEVLREIGEALVDIHGQSEHLSLLNPKSHLDLLDRYADTLSMREALGQVVARLDGIRAQIKALMADKAELQRRADRLRYDVEEINAAELEPGEEDELKAERTRHANSEQLAKLSDEVARLLSDEEERGAGKPAVDQLMQIVVVLNKLAAVDPTMKPQVELATQISDQAQELSIAMKRYGQKIEYSPERLDELEERLELITTLKRRYGGTVEAALAYAEKARLELEGLENSEERLEELRKTEEQLLRHIGELAHRLSAARAVAGRKLAERTVQELADLRMDSTRFEVEMFQEEDTENGCYVLNKRLAFNETGIDRAEFMMSANPGEPLRPLAKVASGGETARIMLALKRVLAQADQTPTLIFDEIDQGIGGRVGAVVGEKLWSLAEGHQVLCVTHLPQLAGYGDRHYRVSKASGGGRTSTQVISLENPVERVEELAAMLGTPNDAGRQSARDLLSEAERTKSARQPEKPVQGKLL